MGATHVAVCVDTAPIQKAIEQLAAALERDPSLKHSLEALLDTPDRVMNLSTVDNDSGAAGAGDLLVRLEPGDGLAVLLAAVRAGDVEPLVIK